MKPTPGTKQSVLDERNSVEGLNGADEPIASEDPSASGNLDKIRDILFGEQARSHDRRFAQLEQHLIREAAELRSDLKRRFDALETYIKQEVEAVMGRLTQEQETRHDAVRTLARELQGLTDNVGRATHQLEQQATEAEARLTQQLQAQADELTQEVHTRHADMASALDHAVQDLRAAKVDRGAIAAILLDASKRLAADSPGHQ